MADSKEGGVTVHVLVARTARRKDSGVCYKQVSFAGCMRVGEAAHSHINVGCGSVHLL